MATAPRLLALDLAGVVCQYDQGTRLEQLAQATGLTAEEVHGRVWDAGLDERLDRGELSGPAVGDAVREALGVPLADDTLRGLWASAFVPDPAVLSLVDRARDHLPTALLTNNGPLILAALEHELSEVGARFDLLGFSCRYRATKPAPEPYRALAAEAGLAPQAILFVDDSPEKVRGAQAVGLEAHRFTTVAALAELLAARGVLV